MSKEPTIILELTPREASLIHELCLVTSWDRGDYHKDVKAVYEALNSIYDEFSKHKSHTRHNFGSLYGGEIWVDEY